MVDDVAQVFCQGPSITQEGCGEMIFDFKLSTSLHIFGDE